MPDQQPAPKWAFWCWRCKTDETFDHRHDRDRRRAEHHLQHPTHTVAVGRIIPGRPAPSRKDTHAQR